MTLIHAGITYRMLMPNDIYQEGDVFLWRSKLLPVHPDAWRKPMIVLPNMDDTYFRPIHTTQTIPETRKLDI